VRVQSLTPAVVRQHRRVVALLLALSLGVVVLIATHPPTAVAAPCDAPVINPVACENTQPGSTDWSDASPDSSALQGFSTDISVNHGSTIGFKIDTTLTYTINIYRMGYYGGAGARKVATIANVAPTDQPNCNTTASTGLIDCGNWSTSATWAVPANAVSGIYFAELRSGTARSHIVFIVRDDSSHSDLYFQTSDTTWQAYNSYGGNSLYVGNPAGRAYKVSYNRPFNTFSGDTFHDFVWNAEYPMVRFLESNGYDVSYESGVDTDRYGSLIKQHKTFMSVGHDEYWSGQQRANVEAARDAGVNLAFFSGNEIFWKTRYENNYRTLVTYKETHANARIDPMDPPIWTGTWRDPRFSPPADGGRPENGLSGTIFVADCCSQEMHVGGADAHQRFWRDTRVANLAAGATTTLGHGVLGYEWDESPDNGFQPAGLIDLSTDTESSSVMLQDYGSNYAPGSATHHLTLYRAKSGALVFSSGSIQWSWGLDNNHWSDVSGNTSDTAVKQATVNLLADMGSQPATLQAGLVAETASTDTTPPTSTITSPAAGATVPVGQPLTISGTATDAGGGVVAGVEVSVDNGASWHPATGRASWSYTFTPAASTTLTILTRATDDSARTETPGPGRTVTVGNGSQPPGSCPCTIWSGSAVPNIAADTDSGGIEVGVKFRTTKAGSITGIRFYKGSSNTGTHVGSLWTTSGTKLASVTFSGESASGWQQANFNTPVPVSANTTYVASYYAPNGHYSTSDSYFTSAITSGPLTALANNTDGPNGVYSYGASGFPSLGYQSTNYWVDVVFDDGGTSDTTPPTITSRTPASNASNVATNTSVSATFSEPVQASTTTSSITVTGGGGTVAGSTSYNATNQTVTFTPGAALAPGTTYTVDVRGVQDTAGNTMSPASWTFTTAGADTTAPTITTRTPATGATNVSTGTTVTATFSEPIQASTPLVNVATSTGTPVAGATSYNATTRTVTFTPSAALSNSTAYTVTVSGAKDTAGNTMTQVNWTFTTASSSGCPCSIWAATTTPGTLADPDNGAVEVGVKFRTSQAGSITGIRFYKSTTNTGTHTGTLWSATGTQLATATFSSESGSGWQQVNFANPIAVSANTTYVASYHTSVGHYSVDENYFASAATTRGPVSALMDGTDGSNGVYRYGASGFPTSSYRSSNYWVDVVFTTN
jgi:methionine-rich copper-binding protein CopC